MPLCHPFEGLFGVRGTIDCNWADLGSVGNSLPVGRDAPHTTDANGRLGCSRWSLLIAPRLSNDGRAREALPLPLASKIADNLCKMQAIDVILIAVYIVY